MKIDQKRNWFAAKFKVRNNLSLMYWCQGLDRFEFNNHCIFNDEIQTVSGV